MALKGDQVGRSGKGKAVNIVHMWKDHLWEMGGKEDPPAPRVIELNRKTDTEADGEDPPSSDPDAPAETTSGSPGEGQPQDKSPKEETNPLSQQGISPSFLESIY
jgi:translation initiation factor 2D